MVLIWEHRIVLPMRVEEYQVGQLYSVAEASKNETGGGEGIEVLVNEPFDMSEEAKAGGHEEKYPPTSPLTACGKTFYTGQYTKKIYHLASKVPGWIRLLAPKGSLRIYEEAWNAYPYCRTVITNPEYMKENFYIIIETMHVADRGQQDNVHGLKPEELKDRRVEMIDISVDPESRSDYKAEWDPKLVKTADGRGPLVGNWQASADPVMCCYKLVRCRFKWWGLQKRVESFIQRQERRLFHNFHKQVYCWLDKWISFDMKSIREYEEQVKKDLDEAREKGTVRGTSAADDDK